MADAPLVSVVLPVHNRAEWVERSVRSVLQQSYGHLELVVVDDGSTDGTDAVVAAIEDERLFLLRHTENLGANAARNTGLEAARGAWIAFQDSDDVWTEDKLQVQLEAAERLPPEVGVVYSAYVRQRGGREEKHPDPRRETLSGDLSSSLLHHNVIALPTALVRAECFARVGGFDPDLPRLQDWELWIRISETFRFHFLEAALVRVQTTEGSISSRLHLLRDAHLKILHKHHALFARDPALLGFQHWQVGHLSALLGDDDLARTHVARALQLAPSFKSALAHAIVRSGGTRVYRSVVAAGRGLRRTLAPQVAARDAS